MPVVLAAAFRASAPIVALHLTRPAVDIPDRADPNARRRHVRVNDFIAHLMDRLDLSHVDGAAAGGGA